MNALKFEKVGDINSEYPYLCVYSESDELNPFMEICISNAGVPGFVLYKNKSDVKLSFENWIEIMERAKNFWLNEMQNMNVGK